jgi:hypothetical protein
MARLTSARFRQRKNCSSGSEPKSQRQLNNKVSWGIKTLVPVKHKVCVHQLIHAMVRSPKSPDQCRSSSRISAYIICQANGLLILLRIGRAPQPFAIIAVSVYPSIYFKAKDPFTSKILCITHGLRCAVHHSLIQSVHLSGNRPLAITQEGNLPQATR